MIAFHVLAALYLVLSSSRETFQTSLPFQYLLLGCKGSNDIRHVARLSRICEDCYALYKDQEIPVTCRDNCYNNEVFDQCVQTIVKEDLIEEIRILAQQIGRESSMPT